MKAIQLQSSKGRDVVKKYVNAARSSQHVVPSNGEWAIKKSNSDRVTKVFDAQREAIACAIKIAKNQKLELVVHGRDGKIKDTFPPRG